MAPTPQKPFVSSQVMKEDEESGERVVISGMSGLFPDCHHVKDLADVLYNKKNPVSSEPRWKYNHPEVVHYTGKVPNLHLFDAQFFKVHYRLGHVMDSMSRKMLEQAYQTIYDAGLSPQHLSGKKVGVFIGTCFSETEKNFSYDSSFKSGLGIVGCNRAMFANRISYYLNVNGPSMTIDEACCSSLTALEQAYLALRRGDCEAAIVGGSNLSLHPQSSVHYGRIIPLSLDGKTKSFDENASGCVKSEAINVLFLQKAKDALRIYAEVIHVKCRFLSLLKGMDCPRYGFNRNPADMAAFLNNFYKEAGVLPEAVEYVEAFGSAVPEADKSELESLDAVFCKNRKNELLVGSVMSNIGYCEAASGISAVIKVLLGYHNGLLAANLNCNNPRRDVPALRDGRMRIVTENQQFGRTFAAINGIAITGVNAHVLLHGHYKPKDLFRYKSNIPYLVTISARQDFAVQNILDNLKSRPIDPEELALLHNIHATRISSHLGRGFAILDTDKEQKTVSLCSKAGYFDNAQRPLWFVYSGMGSQWVGMGTQLMRIPIFAAAIERCRQVLEPKGVDIVQIITSNEKTTFDNILNSFVGIAAIQIGLTDVLRELGLQPDNIIGHSVGELGCAYADGCFTADEMILAAYYRGLVSVQTPFIQGSMAAVGIGYQQVLKMCPPEIEVACHNGPDSCTISGPAIVMREFVAELTSKQIFAKEVPCSNIAYHSRYIAEAGPELLKYLSQVIKSRKPRSARWLSTSVPQENWNEPRAKYSSAEYHTNNLLNPVLFEETSRLIPPNAVLVEVAPHGLLQAILKRSLPGSCCHVPLTRRGCDDNVQFLLEAIGKLYMEGYHPKVQVLYPKIEFPVSTGTPILSHLVKWAHSERWSIPLYAAACRKTTASCTFLYSIYDEENMYLQGNILRGKNTFPFAAALVAAWDVLAMTIGVPKKQFSVQFQDVKLYAQPILHEQRPLRLFISLHRGTGLFEIMDANTKVATGYIISENVDGKPFSKKYCSNEEIALQSEDIYKLLFKRGYDYSGEFQALCNANKSLTEAQIYWRNNWVTLIDGMLQLDALRHPYDSVSEPTHIRSIIIDVERHPMTEAENNLVTAHVFEKYNLIRCGGVAIEDITTRLLPGIDIKTNLLSLKFVPFFQNSQSDISTILLVYIQIVAENQNKKSVNILELSENKDGTSQIENFIESFSKIPNFEIQHKAISKKQLLGENFHILTDVDILLVKDISNDDKLCELLNSVLYRDSFLVNIETSVQGALSKPSAHYRVISSQRVKEQRYELLRWGPTSTASATSVFKLQSSLDTTMLTSSLTALPQGHRLVIITPYPPIDGLKDYVRKWRKERSNIQVVFINDKNAEDENVGQLSNLDLTFNELKNGQWGGTFFVPLHKKNSVSSDVVLQCSRVGDFSSLTWVEKPNTSGNGVKVSVHYAGINNIDVKRCSGILSHDSNQNGFGMDFSGITESGERVMGLVSDGAASSCVLARPELLWPVPGHWTLEEAATVPLAYCLAFYCLSIKYKVYPGMSILIHGGAGALGQAVISVALANGCKVFTTVSDMNKKRFLRKLFPELQEREIGCSRDHTFGDMVLSGTNGHGCNIVISCLGEDLKNVSFKSNATFGITIDLTQVKSWNNFYYGMYNLNNDRSYSAIDFREAVNQGNTYELKKLQRMVSEGITKGYVRPLTRVVYSPLEISRAFRLVAASRQRGRALLQLRAQADNDTSAVFAIQPELRLHCDASSAHLIFCNDDFMGLRIVERLVKRGAKKIYLHGLEPSAYVDFEIRSLNNFGVQVKIYNGSLNSENDVNSLINDGINLGPIEGVYFIATEKQNNCWINLLQMLDSITRKLCPRLKYFGILGSNAHNGLNTCIRRSLDKLPVTVMNLPQIKKMGRTYTTNNGKISDIDAINLFEYALKSTEPVLLAYVRPTEYQPLVQEIARIAGVKIPDEIEETVTLSDLKIQPDKSQLVCTLLRDMHNISVSEGEISTFTIRRLKDLEETLTCLKREATKGLSTFYSYVDPDELLATTEMVFPPTLVNCSGMRDDEFDTKQTYLCLIPGLEGLHARFHTLCERLKLPAIVLQPGLERPDENVSDLAKRYTEILLRKTELKRNFYLMGYESGAMVALEMAAILEKQGLVGTVFCLGESPDTFHVTLKRELNEYDRDETLQIAVAKHMVNLMMGDHANVLDKELKNATTWTERIDVCVRSISGKVSRSAQYARELISCAYGRIKQAQAYKPSLQALRSKLILINASDSAGSIENSLQSYSLQPITVYQLSSPLEHSAVDLRCSAIINSHLDAKLLKEFEKKNLCDTYLQNSSQFMTMDRSDFD